MRHASLTPDQTGTAQRSYTIANKPQPSWSTRRGLDWEVRRYGHGHWCVANGEEHLFRTEADAHAAGVLWLETGRSAVML